jgi:hypothetical protein
MGLSLDCQEKSFPNPRADAVHGQNDYEDQQQKTGQTPVFEGLQIDLHYKTKPARADKAQYRRSPNVIFEHEEQLGQNRIGSLREEDEANELKFRGAGAGHRLSNFRICSFKEIGVNLRQVPHRVGGDAKRPRQGTKAE